MAVVVTQCLRREFGTTVAVESFDVTIQPGEIFGLVGPDGAGKTTILRMLAGVLAPTSGSATVVGCDIGRDPEGAKAHLGYMSQRFGLYPDLTVRENLQFFADLYGVSRQQLREYGSQLLDFSGLAPFQRRRAGELSGGMKQKLGLACALVHRPSLLLLDEPTNGVDPVSRREFWRILYQLLRDGVTILVSTAYLDEAERCSRIGLLHAGGLLSVGPPAEVRRLHAGDTWEVHVEPLRAAAAWLRREQPGFAVNAYGDRLHVAAPGLDEATLKAAFARGNFEVSLLRRIQPSLEDVFIQVLATSSGNRFAAGA